MVRDDLIKTIKPHSKISVAVACFSMYAYQELSKQLDQADEFRQSASAGCFFVRKLHFCVRQLIFFCAIIYCVAFRPIV